MIGMNSLYSVHNIIILLFSFKNSNSLVMILNASYQKISGNFVKINAGNLWEFCVFKLGGHPVYCPVPVSASLSIVL